MASIEGLNDKGKIEWTGTGFIVAADGKVLTNYHVIRNSKQATVRLANGDAYDLVEVMDVDQRKDIALLKIKAVDLQPLRIGTSGNMQVGDSVYSLSNPLGVFDNTLSEGIISGVRQMDGYRLLQITAPISHGSSGGPLFNSKGEVIGITTLTIGEGQSLNFAIPIDYARGMLASPSQPRPLTAVYNPEKDVEEAPAPPPPSAPAPTPTIAKQPASMPEDMRKNVGVFLGTQLLKWTEDDARTYIGTPLTHRYAYDPAHNIIGDIYNFADPTNMYQHIELSFDGKTKRMTNAFLYPARMTWDDCKKLWGDDVNVVKNPDGSQFHNYKNRRLNIFLDKRGNVISLGLY